MLIDVSKFLVYKNYFGILLFIEVSFKNFFIFLNEGID